MLEARVCAGLSKADRLLFQSAIEGAGVSEEALKLLPADALAAIPVVAYGRGVSPGVLRPRLAFSWTHGHARLRGVAGPWLMPMFRHAAYRPPAGLPETVPVWRGVQGMSLDDARRGESWTLDRGTACRFACFWWRLGGASGQALVLRRDIPLRSIVYYWAPTAKQSLIAEVVIDLPPGGDVDPDPSSWRAAALDASERLRVAEGLPPLEMGLLHNARSMALATATVGLP